MRILATVACALLVAATPAATSRTSPPPPRPPPPAAAAAEPSEPRPAHVPALMLLPMLLPLPVPLAMALPSAEREAVLGAARPQPERRPRAAGVEPIENRADVPAPRRTP